MRIVVAMSGGVDSSTAAALLKEAGHEVIGLAMKTHGEAPRANRACCTPDDMRDARRVADGLDIPFYVLNYADVFAEQVIAPFVAAYRAGRTPNPCVACNDKVKFAPLLARAKLLGADRLATGHYARIVDATAVPGQLSLCRGVDAKKDQSYFLYRLDQAQLRMLMFPLGHLRKEEVRAEARRLGLQVADKQESQEICFVGAEGYAKTVERLGGDAPRPGDVVDVAGKVLGRHLGIHHYTLGQRRGVGIASAEPLYVVGLDAATATVRVGPKTALLARSVHLEDVVWAAGTPPPVDSIVAVQQRHRQVPQLARIVATTPDVAGGVALHLMFLQPEVRAAPGQAAVLYVDDHVVGGGTIAANGTHKAVPVGRPGLQVLA
jgi:tRNA-specific 2-thiouridylase